MKCGFSTEFSTIRRPNRVLTPLKSASKTRISSFVPPSQNLRLGGVNWLHMASTAPRVAHTLHKWATAV